MQQSLPYLSDLCLVLQLIPIPVSGFPLQYQAQPLHYVGRCACVNDKGVSPLQLPALCWSAEVPIFDSRKSTLSFVHIATYFFPFYVVCKGSRMWFYIGIDHFPLLGGQPYLPELPT